ncbi:MAG: CHAT domain-containing protein [Deltaproteobacteria bacterium]|nr:CHAT domain-containing protein [Deltaproteobacteria bacterium]
MISAATSAQGPWQSRSEQKGPEHRSSRLSRASRGLFFGLLVGLTSAVAATPFPDRIANLRHRFEDLGERATAEADAHELLRKAREDFGERSLEVADAMDLLVQILFGNGKRRQQQTLDLAVEALQLREALLGPRHPSRAYALHNLGVLRQEYQDFETATTYLEQAIQCWRDGLGQNSLEEARTLEFLGDLEADRDRWQEAEAHLLQVLEIRRSKLDPEHPKVAQAMNTLANVLATDGNYSAAKVLFEDAIGIFRKALKPEDPLLARGLHNLGEVDHFLGDIPSAFTRLEEALEIRRAVYGDIHGTTASTHNSLANLAQDAGDFYTAQKHYRWALEGFRRGFENDHPRYAEALTGLGRLLHELGDWDEARQRLEEALEVRRAKLGPRSNEYGRNLIWLGELAFDAAPPHEAETHLREAVSILTESGDSSHPLLGRALVSLARVKTSLSQPQEAEKLLERALESFTTLGPHHPERVRALEALARLRLAAGRWPDASRLVQLGLQLIEDSYGKGHPREPKLLNLQARVRYAAGRPAAAIENALSAARKTRQQVSQTVSSLAEPRALSYAASVRESLDLLPSYLASSSLASQDLIDRIWDEIIRSRAVILEEIEVRHRVFRAPENSRLAAKAKAWHTARQRFANVLVRIEDSRIPQRRQKENWRRAKQQVIDAEQALVEASRSLQIEVRKPPKGLEAVRRSLPTGSSLIAIAAYRAGFSASGKGGEDGYLAFILPSPSSQARAIPLGRAQDIDDLVEDTRAAKDETLFRDHAAKLRERIWDPLRSHLGDTKRVFLVLDGNLHQMPFGALPDGEASYLIESGPLFHTLTAEKDLVELPTQEPAAGKGLLLLGGASFYDRSPIKKSSSKASLDLKHLPPMLRGSDDLRKCPTFRDRTFLPLPGTLREIQALESLWRRASPNRSPPLLLKAKGASEAAFRRQAPGKKVLHLATHGFFVDSSCGAGNPPRGKPNPDTYTKIDESKKPGGEGPASAYRKAPRRPWSSDYQLTLSGLVMAGANHRLEARGNNGDGILTAEEIASLDLRDVEWAVLSACDSGLGEIQPGEGVLGLRRAFRVAGVRTVIMSLWPVPDDRATPWMKQLYEARFLAGLGPAESVQRASLRILQSLRASGTSTHPWNWGGFVATGAWN